MPTGNLKNCGCDDVLKMKPNIFVLSITSQVLLKTCNCQVDMPWLFYKQHSVIFRQRYHVPITVNVWVAGTWKRAVTRIHYEI